MGRLMRFELTNAGATIRCVRPLHHSRHIAKVIIQKNNNKVKKNEYNKHPIYLNIYFILYSNNF